MPVVRNHYYLWIGLFLAILWPVWTFLGKLCRFRCSSLWWNQENILIFTLKWVYHSCNMCLQLFPLNQYLPKNKIDSREAPRASSSLWRRRHPLSKHMSQRGWHREWALPQPTPAPKILAGERHSWTFWITQLRKSLCSFLTSKNMESQWDEDFESTLQIVMCLTHWRNHYWEQWGETEF